MEKEEHEEGTLMSFFDHLEALRPHLVRSAGAVCAAAVAAFFCKEFLVDTLLFGPATADFPTNRLLHHIAGEWGGEELSSLSDAVGNLPIINTSLAGQFNLHMKISLLVGLSLAMPYVLWEFWRFVRPALTSGERRAARHFVLWVSLCFFAGLLFGYGIMAPLSVNFLSGYRVSTHIVNLFDVGNYLSTVLTVSVACAFLFELPLLICFLTRMRLISSAGLCRYRRHAFVGLLVAAAVITPPDVFSLLLVIGPFYGLYELGIRLSRYIERRWPLP